jgi:glyoxylase-like metal-dependent hydrolase (beta-lactamase superfamily II)
MEILPKLHQIPGIIANSYLIVDSDGLTLVDAGLPNNERKIMGYIESLGHTEADLKRILITHADYDHVGSLAALQRACPAQTYASEVEAEAIRIGQMSRKLRFGGLRGVLMSLASRVVRAAQARVDQILVDGQELPMLGGLRVVETPGHTPGHLSFFALQEGVLFSGDSLIIKDGEILVSKGANTWDEALALRSARLQAVLGAKVVCSGHGEVIQDAKGFEF